MQQSNCINDCGCDLTEDQARMRRDLRYHFMNPKEKWQAKGTLPIKMILIFIKIILITIQVIMFSQNNSNQVVFYEGSKTSFKHLFLKNWDSGYETLSYPPTSGRLAIYRTDEFYETVNYALRHYYELKRDAVGPYSFGGDNKPLMRMCVSHYKLVTITPWNATYVFSSEVMNNCINIFPIITNSTRVFDIKKYLQSKNFTINFDGLITASLKFSLRSVQLKSFEVDELPDCFQFDLTIMFDNSFHNGQVFVDLHTDINQLQCHSSTIVSGTSAMIIKNTLMSLDAFILLLSAASLILCNRSIIRQYKFWKKAKRFFIQEMAVDIANKRNHFWNISYFIIFVGDMFILSGTVIKIEMFSRLNKGLASFTVCNYFLGLGLFFGYITVLRYFSYFPKSSILVNTIRVAIPPLLRFSLCSIILYMAFAILGWTILGPYHLKFHTFESSIACLFSLMMGDEMYVTLSVIQREHLHMYLFSQLYVYSFLLLFIFVVLNLILTIIIEAYDNVKNFDNTVYQLDYFWSFINSCPDTCQSPLYRSDIVHDKGNSVRIQATIARRCVELFCCCIGHESHTKEILNVIDLHNSQEELACSVHGNDPHNRFCSIIHNNYQTFEDFSGKPIETQNPFIMTV